MEAFAAYNFIDRTGSPRDHFVLRGEFTTSSLIVERIAQDVLAYAWFHLRGTNLGIVTLL